MGGNPSQGTSKGRRLARNKAAKKKRAPAAKKKDSSTKR